MHDISSTLYNTTTFRPLQQLQKEQPPEAQLQQQLLQQPQLREHSSQLGMSKLNRDVNNL